MVGIKLPTLRKDVSKLTVREQTTVILNPPSNNRISYIMPEKVLATYRKGKKRMTVEYMTVDVQNDLVKRNINGYFLKTLQAL